MIGRRFHVTSTGIAIGCAHVRQPRREIGSEAEKIQRLLLAPLPRQVHEVGRRPIGFYLWRWLKGMFK